MRWDQREGGSEDDAGLAPVGRKHGGNSLVTRRQEF